MTGTFSETFLNVLRPVYSTGTMNASSVMALGNYYLETLRINESVRACVRACTCVCMRTCLYVHVFISESIDGGHEVSEHIYNYLLFCYLLIR